MPAAGHTAITVPRETHARVSRLALVLAPEVGRRISLAAMVDAALKVAEKHRAELLAELNPTKDQEE